MASFAQLIGKLLILASFVIFVYFTTWLFFSQYFAPDSGLQNFFPPLSIALYGPLFLLAGFVGFLVIFLVRATNKMKKKK